MAENRNHNQCNICDQLAAYELNLLEKDERIVFENHLGACSDCLEEMYAMAPAMTKLIDQPGLYAGQVTRSLAPGKTESWFQRLNRMVASGTSRLLIPVAVVAVLAMLILMPQSTEIKFRSLATTEAPAFSPIQVRAGQQDLWLPLWQSGMAFYQDGQYPSAADDLAKAVKLLAASAPSQDELTAVLDNAQLYLGVSQMLSNGIAESLATLQDASESSLQPVRQKGLWYLAQAHLLNENPQDAMAVLTQLENSPVFGTQAAALKADIENLLQN